MAALRLDRASRRDIASTWRHRPIQPRGNPGAPPSLIMGLPDRVTVKPGDRIRPPHPRTHLALRQSSSPPATFQPGRTRDDARLGSTDRPRALTPAERSLLSPDSTHLSIPNHDRPPPSPPLTTPQLGSTSCLNCFDSSRQRGPRQLLPAIAYRKRIIRHLLLHACRYFHDRPFPLLCPSIVTRSVWLDRSD